MTNHITRCALQFKKKYLEDYYEEEDFGDHDDSYTHLLVFKDQTA